ncbi:hypothetical protein [Thermococcus thioreducens]|uniref:Phosphate transport system protein n=1 Tax=Thermococcus thioreducens TaxID=277988 RepID=A0A0Q2M4X0_9EURY|nr:hypothetical protein [Thermococcus thioreducens]ASJ12215.1 phosphate transporter PhoU [Thermococcus thioreducens]KQH82954.1 phosphate transporter PhoU [Thermococcus thioreducens]SEV94754.1 phosphate transport system protein [Thermococcus thioreducens]
MKRKLFARLKEWFEELGEITLTATGTLIKEAQRNEYGQVDDLLWKAIDVKDELNDTVIEALIRCQPLARDMRFVRSIFTASYDAYRIVRHCSRVEAILTIDGRESARSTVIEGLMIIQPWLERGVSTFTRDEKPPVHELPFFESAFEEFWETNVKTDDPYVMGVLIHCEGIFNHTKHLLRAGVYYLDGSRGLEKTPILMVD